MLKRSLARLHARCPTFNNPHVLNCCIQKRVTRTFFGLPNLSSISPLNDSDRNIKEQTYCERKILPYTRKQLYDLVSNVDDYHRFVPYCTESRVLKSVTADAQEPGLEAPAEKKEARLTVGFLAFKESYISEVTCRPYHSVQAVAASGTPLFRTLSTTWRFEQPARNTSISFSSIKPSPVDCTRDTTKYTLLSIELAYAFANPLYESVSSTFFKEISAMMVEAFEKRCVNVYGRVTI